MDKIVQQIYDNINNEIDSKIKKDNIILTKLELINKLTSECQTQLVDYTAENNQDIILNDLTRCLSNIVKNLFDIDIKFIKQGYHLDYYTNEDIVNHVKNNNYINYIYHPKQLYNLFNNIKLLVDNNNYIYVKYENIYYKLNHFLKHIETYSYNEFKNITIKEIENKNFTDNKLLILIYIGSEKVIDIIFEKLKYYSQIETFSLGFCINQTIINNVVPLIPFHFTNYIIYSSNEFGNDITPSMLMYDEITNKYNFEYIFKIHTKTDIPFLHKAIDCLFNTNLEKLLLTRNPNSSSIGFMYTIKYHDMYFNKMLYSKYEHLLKKIQFIPGSIFLTEKCTMDSVLQFLKDNYKIIFFQNMYDNNSLNIDSSYVHFMERLFGYI